MQYSIVVQYNIVYLVNKPTSIMQINITNNLKHQATLGIVACKVQVAKSNSNILTLLTNGVETVKQELSLETFTDIKAITDSRAAYSALGRNPSRYPVSSEALIKRILQGKGLYYINNVVDLNNLISIRSGYSVGSYSIGNTIGDIVFRQGHAGEKYKGIGKAEFDLEDLPLLADCTGAFGSPTSDSERAMITPSTQDIIMVIYGFGTNDLTLWIEQAKGLLQQHAHATAIETFTF